MSIQNPLKLAFDSVVEIHSFQDGLVIGTILALSIHYPPALTILAIVLGIDGIKPRKLIRKADEIVRTDDIEKAPEYFLGGFLLSALGVSGLVLGALELGVLEFIPL